MDGDKPSQRVRCQIHEERFDVPIGKMGKAHGPVLWLEQQAPVKLLFCIIVLVIVAACWGRNVSSILLAVVGAVVVMPNGILEE